MTARCPLGCDWWGIPPAVEGHVRSGNYKREPWALGCSGELLVARGERARFLAVVPPELKRPAVLGDREARPLVHDR
jgi:hypothetical protein